MYKILSVDDSKSVQSFIKASLSDFTNLSLDFCENGQVAIEKIQNENLKYDLVLLDWEMPVLTGPQTYKKLRELKIDFPVIMVTSKNKPDEIGQMLRDGVLEYVMKPFTKEILIEKIKTVLTGLK